MMKNLLIGLAIIHKNGKVLIGARKEKDEFVEHLRWVFPGGKIVCADLESEIKKIAKEETGLDVSVNGIASARKIPEAKIDIVAVYFDCAAEGDEKAGGDLKELKWVPATSVIEYFTTSVSNEVMAYLKRIEENKL
ncbi:MAG: NUDIX hydrolase [Candidatus Aenigmatarchaeota archaeon]